MDPKRIQRIRRIRARLSGTAERPRICIERTAKHFRVQFIDDQSGKTVLAGGDHELKSKLTGIQQAHAVGKAIAGKAKQAGLKQAVLDRRGYRYHGRIAAFAKTVRESGLTI
ncbi:50S ribosomal protein L18 [Candidatus Berkelbacteria bacterium]|nr:50S ribosomal protein L18 [Candidatus Berkelbacteria bacterium]